MRGRRCSTPNSTSKLCALNRHRGPWGPLLGPPPSPDIRPRPSTPDPARVPDGGATRHYFLSTARQVGRDEGR